jgi:hypothetical protein
MRFGIVGLGRRGLSVGLRNQHGGHPIHRGGDEGSRR